MNISEETGAKVGKTGFSCANAEVLVDGTDFGMGLLLQKVEK